MSDVWQGPGWWLASDGKWYPADAQPGAVYDGDLSESATEPGVAVGDAGAPTEPTTSISPGSVNTVPGTTHQPTELAASETAVESASADGPSGAVFDAMPAPVVEGPRGGGWQAVQPDAPSGEAPEPTSSGLTGMFSSQQPDQTIDDTSEPEDGWTSAFEERQTVNDILDAAPAAPSVPAEPDPSVAFLQGAPTVPQTPTPPAAIPDLAIPDLAAPNAAIPNVAAPDVAVPNVAMPDVAAPNVAMPDVAAPNVAMPDVAMPDVAVPNPPAPQASIPAVETPPVAAPEIFIPEVQAPTAAAPTVPEPGLATPNMDLANPVPFDTAVERQSSDPIERSDAWRKPTEAGAVARPASAPAGAPEVVDLAVPQDAPTEAPEPTGSSIRPILYGVIALAAIIGLAFLITQLFTGDDDTTDDSAVATDTTEQDEDSADLDPADTERSQEPPTTEAETEDDSPEDTSVSVFELRAGDCIVGDIGAGQVTEVSKVDCEQEHQFEVYREALIESSITVFDEEAISAYAEEVCRTSLEAYIPPDDDRGLKFKFLQPTEDSWNQADEPDRVITCLLFDEDAPLVGRAG